MAKHNWDQIRKEYIEGIEIDGQLRSPTQAEMSKKYGIDPAIVCKRAKKDQWEVQREIFINKVSTKRQEKKAETISNEGSQFDLDCFNAAKVGMEKALRQLESTFSPDDVNKLSTAMKNFQQVAKAALGDKEPTDVTIRLKLPGDLIAD